MAKAKFGTGLSQLSGCLSRMAIERKRSVRGTCCEFCSHLVLLLILVFGYSLSVVEKKDAETYTSLEVKIPPTLFEENADVATSALDQYNQIMNGPLVIPDLDQYVALGDVFSGVSGSFLRLLSATGFRNAFTNLLDRGTLHFSPNDGRTESLINYLNQSYSSFNNFDIMIHESEKDGVNYILDNLDSPAFALISLFQVTPEKVNYAIRQNYTTLPNTNTIVQTPAIGINQAYQQYFFSGFLTLQRSVDEWVFDYLGASDNEMYPNQCSSGPMSSVLAPYPTAAYDQNPFYTSVGFLLGLVMVMSTLYPVSKLTKSIVEEKETKMRELMMIMGLPEWVHRASWFLMAFVLFFWIAISSLFITSSTFLLKSDKTLLFFYFFFFCISEINFAFLLSVFFSNAKLAAIAGPVLLFAAILPRYIFLNTTNNEQVVNKVLACILSPSAFAFGADIISDYEYANVGVQYYNLFNDRFNFGTVMIMLFIDFYIYGFLAWYLDQVLPHENGTPKHPLFIFDGQYWLSCVSGWCWCWNSNDGYDALDDNVVAHGVGNIDFSSMPEFNDSAPRSTIEAIEGGMIQRAKIRLKGLGKQYPDGKVAVRNLSLSMLQGQITCLLGHNGAGKTTSIAMLTGLIEATTGDVSIYGHSLKRDLHSVRRITGLCPQLNVLFPLLTVEEHLRFFGTVKGLMGRELRDACDQVLIEVGLTEKRHVRSQALSGGMKRKLCLAMALIGDPKFVLLDEPTSGMDPYSRRSTWELLQRSKAGRVILLTTHFMDEADTLADRIAIMSEGTLLCAGSSLFLKSKFGVGYLLSMSKSVPDASVPRMQEEIQHIVPDAKVHSSVAGEVIFQLPLGTSSSFSSLFQMLRDKSGELHIGSYGISITTLEQVFIMLSHHKPPESSDGSALIEDSLTQSRLGKAIRYIGKWFADVFPFGTSQHRVVTPTAAEAARRDQIETLEYAKVQVRGEDEAESGTNAAVTAAAVTMEMVSTPVVPDSEILLHSTNGGSEKEQNKPDIAMVDSGTGGVAETNIGIQLYELYMKRIVVLRRDVKGFFFQIVFPALLIVLIMLILTVRLNISGPTLILNANMYHRYGQVSPTVVMAGNVESPLVPNINAYARPNRYTMESAPPEDSTNSSALSRFLLFDKQNFTDDRHGAFVFTDQLPLDLTINWDWVSSTLADNEISGDIIGRAAIAFLGVNYTIPLTVTPAQLNQLGLSFSTNNATVTIGGNSIVIPLNILPNNTVFSNALRNVLVPGASLSVLNITDQLLTNNIPGFQGLTALLASFNVTPADVDLVVGNITNNVLTLTLQANNVTINLPQTQLTIPDLTFGQTAINVTLIVQTNGLYVITPNLIPGVDTNFLVPWSQISSSSILPFLPDGTIQQYLSLPSSVTILHNTTSAHGAAALHGQLVQSNFQLCINRNMSSEAAVNSSYVSADGATADSYTQPLYYVKNHPLPITEQQSLQVQIILSLLASIFILVPLCYIPASFVAFLVKERVSKSKHLQLVSGVSPYLYWLAAYLWDMTLFAFLTLFVICCLYIFGRNVARVFIGSSEQTLGVFCLLFFYGAAAIPLAYLYSFGFTNFSTAQIAIMVINFMTGFVLVLAYFIMSSVPYTQNAAEILVHIFRFFPAYNVGEGLINLSTNYFEREILDAGSSVWAWEVIGRDLTFLFAQAVGYMLMVLLSETPYVRNLGDAVMRWQGVDKLLPPPRATPIDDDVKQEEELVRGLTDQLREQELLLGAEGAAKQASVEAGGGVSDVVLVIDQLVKTYPSLDARAKPKYAVRGMSLACYDNERFGLLGINGAGKTTTLGVLTCEIQATLGEVRIGGRSLSDPQTMQMLGYCPQVDPLLELMNAYETLWFYGRIRGIPTDILNQRIQSLIQQTGLTPHALRPSGTYSGGNKRKLSLAVALIGDPKVLLLDEPSTGMDPEARRQMWTVIQQVSAHRTVILVSHSMEEIEALCTRVGVMVSGRLQCLGAIQHLKGKFGSGYQVEVRCGVSHVQECLALCDAFLSASNNISNVGDESKDEEKRGDVVVSFSPLGATATTGTTVPNPPQVPAKTYEIEEEHGGYFRLHVPGNVDLAAAFDALERNKAALEIYDYSISQCSLEQVFIRFAREQEEETASPSGLSGHRTTMAPEAPTAAPVLVATEGGV